MENDLFPKPSQKVSPREDVIDAEWVEVEPTQTPSANPTEPATVYLVTQPYRPSPETDPWDHSPPPGETLLDRLLTPWGIAGFVCFLTGNILLSWTQATSSPEQVAQTKIATRAEMSPTQVHSANFPPAISSLDRLDRQPLDVSQLSSLNIPNARPMSPSDPIPAGPIQSPGTPLTAAILPASVPLPTVSSSRRSPAIAKTPASSPIPPQPTLPVVPIVLQSRSIPTLPPPPPAPQSSLPISPAPLSPSDLPPPPAEPIAQNDSTDSSPGNPPIRVKDYRPPQSFNQKTREQLLNLANQLPSSTENPGVVQQLRQEIQHNQGY